MGWDIVNSGPSKGKPQIYNYFWNQTTETSRYEPFINPSDNLRFFSWQLGSIWVNQGVAVKYINDLEVPVVINSISMGAVACNSGSTTFYSTSGIYVGPSYGGAAKYTVSIDVYNSSVLETISSSPFYDIPTVSNINLNNRGSGKDGAINAPKYGVFGNAGRDYLGNNIPISATIEYRRKYIFTESPKILPGKHAYVNLRITPASGVNVYSNYYRFDLDPNTMESNIEVEPDGYIWVMTSEGWKLKQPYYMQTSKSGWKSVEDL